jgi:hypothetical protein
MPPTKRPNVIDNGTERWRAYEQLELPGMPEEEPRGREPLAAYIPLLEMPSPRRRLSSGSHSESREAAEEWRPTHARRYPEVVPREAD